MSIDPKKGGKCWSCKFSEDIATQTNNEDGAYYRKCTKSGHEYIDTCKFSCSDYVWDGKDPDFAPSTSSSSSSSSATSSSSAPAAKSTGNAVGKLIGALITTAVFAFLTYLLLGYSEYLLAQSLGTTTTLPVISDAYTLEAVVILTPLVMSIIWSIIKRRKIWIGALLTLIACVMVNGMIGEDTTPSHIPLFFAMLIIPYILCLFASLKGKKAAVSGSGASSSSYSSSSSSSASAPTQRTYSDYECYQCSYYWVDADYNGICRRSNGIVDRNKTACSSFSKK